MIIKKIKNIFNKLINLINKYNLRFLKKIIVSLLLYFYAPDTLMYNTNLSENEKMFLMGSFIVFSGIMSYILKNYQWKAPGTESDSVIYQNITSMNDLPAPAGIVGWKLTLWRILLSLR